MTHARQIFHHSCSCFLDQLHLWFVEIILTNQKLQYSSYRAHNLECSHENDPDEINIQKAPKIFVVIDILLDIPLDREPSGHECLWRHPIS